MKNDEAPRPNVCFPRDLDYRAMVSVIQEGIVILQEERIVFTNPAFSLMAGGDPAELVGRSFLEFVSPGDRETVRDFLGQVHRGDSGRDQIFFELQADSPKIVEMKVASVQCEEKEAILASLSDVTERRLKRNEVERLHNRLRSIIDSMRHVVLSFSYNEEADRATVRDFAFYDRYLTEINPAAEALYGVPRADFLDKRRSIFDFVYGKDRDKVLSHYNNLFEEGIAELMYRVLGPNQEIRWVLDYGRVEYLEGGKVRRVNHILEDITREKKATDELRANEEKYRRIFERSKDMIYILRPDGSFIDINPAGVELLGLGSRAEAGSRNMKEFHVDPKQRDVLIREIVEKGEVSKSRLLLKNRNGDPIEVDLNLIARRDEAGNVISYQGIVHNITESLRQKELEAIGQLAGCFADDLASPLNVTLMGISAVNDFLTEIREDLVRWGSADEAAKREEILTEIRGKLEEVAFFSREAVVATRDIKARLVEIRDQYWSLKKVSDGAGGMIYQRGSKT